MKPRDYCCCAIPVINFGIYITLLEQFMLALLVAILALATPDLVGASVGSYGKVILAIVCFVAAGIQVMGYFGVFQNKPILFRRYTTLHIMTTLAAFSVALAWIVMSAVKHSTAKSDCIDNFFSNSTSDDSSSTGDEASILCDIFTWVDVGLMGGLWLILAIMQFYLYTVISSYGTGQRKDNDAYKTMYSTNAYDSGIPLANRNDPWDARPSLDDELRQPLAGGPGHRRLDSDASVSTIMAEKQQQEANSIYPPQRSGTYSTAHSQPANVYTQEPQPTPYGGEFYHQGSGGYRDDLQAPMHTQSHPAEGMFGRKTARLQRIDQRPYGNGDYDF